MHNPFETREIWFLTGSQGLYGPETLDQVAAQSRTLAETLDAASDIPLEIVWNPLLTDRDANLDYAPHGGFEFGSFPSRQALTARWCWFTRAMRSCSPGSGAGPAPRPAGPRCSRRSSPASVTTCATSPSPRVTRPRRSCGSASP